MNRSHLYGSKQNINLIYYAYINRNSNWKEIISGQLLHLKSYGILNEVTLYIHITDTSAIFEDVIAVIEDICINAILSLSTKNHYEYPALTLAYELALRDPGSIIIYLHTKGMSHNIQSRLTDEIALLTGTFGNWRKNLELFRDETINKIGMFPAAEDPEVIRHYGMKRGWMWINFWYARASYLISFCEVPKFGTNRWYYEVWLGGPHDGSILKNDCYSLYSEDRSYFNVSEMELGMENLKASLKQ